MHRRIDKLFSALDVLPKYINILESNLSFAQTSEDLHMTRTKLNIALCIREFKGQRFSPLE